MNEILKGKSLLEIAIYISRVLQKHKHPYKQDILDLLQEIDNELKSGWYSVKLSHKSNDWWKNIIRLITYCEGWDW